MRASTRNCLFALTLGLLPPALTSAADAPPAPDKDGIVVPMAPSPASPFEKHGARKGSFTLDGKAHDVLIPDAQTYSLANTASVQAPYANTSTPLYVDSNGDGQITRDELWHANLPVRIGDRMFDVAAIAPDGASVTFKPSKAPLGGAVTGLKCPAFSFKTTDGKTITLDDYKGKVLYVDVWSAG